MTTLPDKKMLTKTVAKAIATLQDIAPDDEALAWVLVGTKSHTLTWSDEPDFWLTQTLYGDCYRIPDHLWVTYWGEVGVTRECSTQEAVEYLISDLSERIKNNNPAYRPKE
jgi:hypothetical protein